jgi:formylglycine-generating enzyme required for sulfatase activity
MSKTHQAFGETVVTRTRGRVLGALSLWLVVVTLAWAQERQPLSVEDIEYLLSSGVTAKRVATLIGKEGIAFEVTDALKERLRRAGADEGVMSALDRASLEAARRKLEEERKRIEDAQRRLEETQRKAEEDRKRQEEVQRRAVEEARRKEEETRRREEAKKREEEVAQRATAAGMVRVGNFQIDRTEVTVAAYQRCVQAGQCSRPGTGAACNWGKGGRDLHPINCVSFEQARDYCEWAGKRLPDQEEWNRAAYGSDGRQYTWGNNPDARRANLEGAQDGYAETAPVGSFSTDISPAGALDMTGNVAEWTAGGRVVRGGSFSYAVWFARSSDRIERSPGDQDAKIGFRCAR